MNVDALGHFTRAPCVGVVARRVDHGEGHRILAAGAVEVTGGGHRELRRGHRVDDDLRECRGTGVLGGATHPVGGRTRDGRTELRTRGDVVVGVAPNVLVAGVSISDNQMRRQAHAGALHIHDGKRHGCDRDVEHGGLTLATAAGTNHGDSGIAVASVADLSTAIRSGERNITCNRLGT